jgi:hypothetical protein
MGSHEVRRSVFSCSSSLPASGSHGLYTMATFSAALHVHNAFSSTKFLNLILLTHWTWQFSVIYFCLTASLVSTLTDTNSIPSVMTIQNASIHHQMFLKEHNLLPSSHPYWEQLTCVLSIPSFYLFRLQVVMGPSLLALLVLPYSLLALLVLP